MRPRLIGKAGMIYPRNWRQRRFTLVEILTVIAILGILLAMLLPSLRRAREYAREAYCMNNARQIAIGYRQYLDDHKVETPMPDSGFFLDDLSPSVPYVKMLDVYHCPSTTTARPASVAAMVNGGDYLVAIFKGWKDIELSVSNYNNGHGNSVYGLDPSNPAFKKAGGMALLAQFKNGVIYENNLGNHFAGFRNVLYVSDFHYEKTHTTSGAKFLTLVPGGMMGRRVEKFW